MGGSALTTADRHQKRAERTDDKDQRLAVSDSTSGYANSLDRRPGNTTPDQTGTPPAWAWIFPAIIDATIGVSTMMLVALGDKPARRAPRVSTQTATVHRAAQTPVQSAKAEVAPFAPTSGRAQTALAKRVQTSASVEPDPVQTLQDLAQIEATQVDARPCVRAD